MSSPQAVLKKIKGQATAHNLKLLYNQLVNIRSTPKLIKKDPQSCKEIISLIIEFLIKGERANQSDLFDTFCELNFLNEFILLANIDDYEINLTIIDSFSLLLINLTNITSLYYIFSNNFINQIISKDYTYYDENFLSFYINFLKSLSLRIDTKTIEFFYRSNVNSFPLVQCALKLYNFHDSMIRTCVRNILMTVLKIKYDKIQDHFTTLPTVEYFIFIVLHLRDLALNLENELNNTTSPSSTLLSNLIGDILDEILYVNDIFALHLKKINYVVMNSLFTNFIIPVLCESLVTKSKPKISISISIFILILFIDNIKDESFSNVLFTILLNDQRSHDLIEYFKPPKDNRNFINKWGSNTNRTSQKSLNAFFIDFLATNYSEGFLMSLLSEKNAIYSIYQNFGELKEINKKIQAKIQNTSTEITVNDIRKVVHESIAANDIRAMKDYHKSVGKSIGLVVGVYSNNDSNGNGGNDEFECGFMFEMMKFYQIAKLQYVDKSHLLFSNQIKSNLFSYLESKDDTLLLLVNMILFFSMEKTIAPYLISEAKLINFNKKNNESNSTNNYTNDLIYLNSIFFNKENGIDSNSINNPYVSFNSFIFNNQFFANMSKDTIKPDLVLIKNLVKLLLINPPLRKITSELILLNLNHLLICNSTKSLQVNLPKDICELFNKILIKTKSCINEIISQSQQIKEKAFELFKEEWVRYTTNTTPLSSLLTLLEQPCLLIPNNAQELIEDYPNELKAQTSDIAVFRYHLLIYMKVHDLALIILNQTKTRCFIKKGFPLQGNEYEFDLNMSYNISSLNEENSYIIESKLKSTSMTEYIDVVIILYFSFLYFGVYDDNNKDFALIRYKNYLGNLCLIKHLDEKDVVLIQLIDKDEPQFWIKLLKIDEEYRDAFVIHINDWTATAINNDAKKFCSYFQKNQANNST